MTRSEFIDKDDIKRIFEIRRIKSSTIKNIDVEKSHQYVPEWITNNT